MRQINYFKVLVAIIPGCSRSYENSLNETKTSHKINIIITIDFTAWLQIEHLIIYIKKSIVLSKSMNGIIYTD